MPRTHPREPRHVRGINRWRAWCGESRTPGSEGSCTEKARVHPLGTRDLAVQLTLLNVLAPGAVPHPAGREDEDPEDGGKRAPGAPHVLAVRTPGERLTWLQALGSRRKEDVTGGIPARFTGFLITDGYTAYQRLLSRL